MQADNMTVRIDTWPMQSDRMAIEDPLLECLVALARAEGRRTSVAALAAGLPLSTEGFASPALFVRAAERIDMAARLVRRPLIQILRSPGLPCILVMKDRHACILKSWTEEGGAVVILPETPETETVIETEKLEALYDGYAFFVKGRARIDGRAGPKAVESRKGWFWGTLARHKHIYYQVALTAFMVNCFALVSPVYIMNVYDRVLPNGAFDTLIVLTVGAGIVMLFDFFLKNLRTLFLDAAGRKADVRISSAVFEHVLSMRMAMRPQSAGALADNMREFETLRDFFTSATVVTFIDMPFVLMFVALIAWIGGPIVAVPVITVIIIACVGWGLQKPLARVVEEHAREGAYKTGVIIETLNGLETIKVQAVEGHMQRKWEEVVEKSSLTSTRVRALSALGVSFSGFGTSISYFMTVFYGVHLVAAGTITTGALIACVILSGRIIAPLTQFASMLSRFNQSRTALNRLNKLMEIPVERESGEAFVSRPVLQGNIAFRDVTFRYPGMQTDSLSRVSFDIKAGEKVGVIGSVGSGKTTLQRLILNLYQPAQGAVEIDGLDVRQMEPGDLRRNVGVAQQDAYLFYGTIRDNIILGHEAVRDDAVLRAAELAGISDFMKDTTTGLDTPVGERGEFLSGGQRQAISIARALLYDPPILILDEPTASIDPKSEKMLLHRLDKICRGKTVVLITHRTPLLALVDKLILMDRGRIVAYGPRNDIISGLQAGQYKPASPESEGG